MDSNLKSKLTQIEKHKYSLLNDSDGISLTAILNSEGCQNILGGCREYRARIYAPFKTVFTFIKQVLNPDKSYKKAVAGIVVDELSTGKNKISSNTGPYCKARQPLLEEAV